tara:strand:+ start:41 stop:217 length:177 start_codon:yes stop_codon:yes gene_type:complete
MIFPKPEWISYKATHWKAGVGEDEINIYAHGEQMVRDILADYVVTKIERNETWEDKDD